MNFKLVIILLCLMCSIGVDRVQTAPTKITIGDSVEFYSVLREVEIRSRNLSRKEIAEYQQLVYNIRRTYPYAKLAGERYRAYQDSVKQISTNKEKRKLAKILEEEIRRDFLEDLKTLSTVQGEILFKLLCRETGLSAYSIIKEIKNGWTAFGFQIVGSVYGYNLKKGYDPKDKDFWIEVVVKQIEEGKIRPIEPQKLPALSPKQKRKRDKDK